MRIAFITPDNRDACRQFTDPRPSFSTGAQGLLDGLALLPECEVHVVCCVRQPVALPEKIGQNIFYHAEVVPKWGWIRGAYLRCIHSVHRQVRRIQPDIVHGQGTESYAAISAVFSGFPNVLTIQGNMRLIAKLNNEPMFSYNWLMARLEAFTLPRTDGVVCITHYTRRAVEQLARRTWVLPHAVDASFFDLRPAPPDGPPIVLCVGSIDQRKNQNAFIRALDPLAAQKKFKVVFLGQASDSAYCAEFFQLVGERPWCEHVGFSGRERVKEFFKIATLLALPTREDNCPMVVLEAMAAGVPVLASEVGGVPDLIQSETTGLFCDPQRPDSFREGVARLLEDRELSQRLAIAARAAAQTRFDPRAIAIRHLEIYREVLANHRQ